jgi:uncharacterized protein (DUF433 family)
MSNSHQQYQAHFIDKREISKQPLLPRSNRIGLPQSTRPKLFLSPNDLDHLARDVSLHNTSIANKNRHFLGRTGLPSTPPNASFRKSEFRRSYDGLMPWPERIIVDTEILAGKPVIRGTRIAVELILELLAAGQPEHEILANYPGLTREDVLACLSYASYLAHEYRAYPISA